MTFTTRSACIVIYQQWWCETDLCWGQINMSHINSTALEWSVIPLLGLKLVSHDPNLALGLDAVHTLSYDLCQAHLITECYILIWHPMTSVSCQASDLSWYDLHTCMTPMSHTTIDNSLLLFNGIKSELENSELTLQLKVSPSLTTHSTCMRLFQPVCAYTLLRNVWDRLALVRLLRTIRSEFSLQLR